MAVQSCTFSGESINCRETNPWQNDVNKVSEQSVAWHNDIWVTCWFGGCRRVAGFCHWTVVQHEVNRNRLATQLCTTDWRWHSHTAAYLEIWTKKVTPGYISGVHFQQCSNFSIFFHIKISTFFISKGEAQPPPQKKKTVRPWSQRDCDHWLGHVGHCQFSACRNVTHYFSILI